MMLRMFLSALSISALVYIAFSGYLFAQQRSLLYFPTPEAPLTTVADRFALESDGEVLQVWALNPGHRRAVLYFGGNAEAVENNLAAFRQTFPQYTVYLPNYRGFGGSSGMPTEAGLYRDALALYDRIAVNHPSVAVIGRSLGSGVATYVAANRRVDHLVLVTPFDSIERLARRQYPVFPIGLLLQDKFDSLQRVADIDAQTLILLAEEDRIIPQEHSLRLVAAFPKPQVHLDVIPQTDHNTIDNHPMYLERLQRFLEDQQASSDTG